jgi:hypothetical protein
MSASEATPGGHERDPADLARFGYKQELKRSLGVFSVFAVAFSYISPSTGIFTLFALGLATLGGVFIWTWPVVALGQFIVALNFSLAFATLYLFVVSAAIFVCCLSIMALTIRLCFGMARDHQLRWSRPLAEVAPSLHTPVWACITVAVLAAVPFLRYSGAVTVAIAATGMIYLSYFPGNLVIMRARLRGWPRTRAPFRLGRWGPVVNVLALLYGGAMLVNFAWPRAISNPKPDQTAGALSLGLSFLNRIPILWTLVLGIAVIGVIYYLAAGRRQPFTLVVPSAEQTSAAGNRA